MSFQHPWLLLGLLAAAIPIAIHLINRQRAPVIRFAALEHLLLSDRRLAQRLKLRQFLVLLLRIGLIVAIALALAKPSLTGDLMAEAEITGPGAVALVIDDSLSMNATLPGADETLLQRALAEAEAMVARGGPRTSFAVITAGAPATIRTADVTYDRQAIARALAAITAGPRSGDMAAALREAERVLAETGQAKRHVVILGDQAAHAWEEIDNPWALDEPPSVELVDVREGVDIPNLALVDVQVHPAIDVGPDHVRVTTTATNHGGSPSSATITLTLGERTAKARMDLDAREQTEVTSTLVRPASDAPFGVAALPGDALPDDDTRGFGLGDGEAIRVGLVNGAPHDVPSLDELFFLRAALDSTGPGPPLRTTPLDPSRLAPARLAHLDVVILANVGPLEPASLASLRDFVRSGGGLWITAGDRLTVEAARSLGELLPIPVRGHKEVADPDDPDAALNALHISDFDQEHPVTALFGAVDDVSLLKARTYRVALLDPTGRRARVIATFSGGIPALVEGQVGDGRVMLLTTTVDRDWSDLVIRTSFVPLVHQIAAHLAHRSEGLVASTVRVGEVARVRLPPGRGGLVLSRPDGAEVMLDAPEPEESERALATEAPSIAIGDIDVVGHYALRRRVGHRETVYFTAHGDPRESDLSPADLDVVAQVLTRSGPGELAMAAALARDGDGRTRHPLWPYLLVSLFALLVSEAWLVLRQ